MAAKRVLLFDVDGTLTTARKPMTEEMTQFMERVRRVCPVAVVGGSDMPKICEQMGDSIESVVSTYAYVFSENGLVSYRSTEKLPVYSIHDELGEKKLQQFINFCLRYMSDIELPVKRFVQQPVADVRDAASLHSGNFIEFRKGMINVSPIGRSCSYTEREQFVTFDHANGVRLAFVEAMRKHFPVNEYRLQFSLGGQISIDVFPVGWDKTFCLQYLLQDGFTEIHFFGDRTDPGGNDHEVFADARTIGHSVTSPADTRAKLAALLNIDP